MTAWETKWGVVYSDCATTWSKQTHMMANPPLTGYCSTLLWSVVPSVDSPHCVLHPTWPVTTVCCVTVTWLYGLTIDQVMWQSCDSHVTVCDYYNLRTYTIPKGNRTFWGGSSLIKNLIHGQKSSNVPIMRFCQHMWIMEIKGLNHSSNILYHRRGCDYHP